MQYYRENIALLRRDNPIAFGRFIMALKNLEDSDDWSRICGIHGNTFKPGDPAVKCPTDPKIVELLAKTGEPFYCAHSVEPFIAWHVPYLYEFEQLLNLYDRSKTIGFITLPYFDITDQHFDYSFLNEPTISILYDNTHLTITNPLASAFFYPNGIKTPITRQGYLQATTPAQKLRLKTIRRQLYDTLHAKTYEEFSSQLITYTKTYKPYPYVPLETPHNSIHDIIGGEGGNMSFVDISAFDPLFWLHHSNMERFFYNWLLSHDSSSFTHKSLQSTLAPFSPNFITFGWENSSIHFLFLRDVLDNSQFPYKYHPIVLKDLSSQSAFINIIDIPIPPETVVFNAYIYPKNEPNFNKDIWYAGSASWFGIDRSTKYCNRCTKTRTNIKIDVLDFVIQKGIHKDNIENFHIFIEPKGKLIRDSDGKYHTYSMHELLHDGEIRVDIP